MLDSLVISKGDSASTPPAQTPATHRAGNLGAWRVSIGFESKDKAEAFEAYLKTGSGRAFLRRRFVPKRAEMP